ncbi:MAG: hypothetical protein R8P61_19655 [Bacteroidia bacterium]|nr:hypothetical protein [Bacteroidia bacterium]
MKTDTKTGNSFLIFFLLFLPGMLLGNNLQIENIELTGQNPGQDYTLIKFDLSWDNSWRVNVGPANWDAAWIFVKFRIGSGDWQHATLNYLTGDAVQDGHKPVPGSIIKHTDDGVGAFLYRDVDGSGNNDWNNLLLRWNYGVDGVNDNDIVEVQVMGIEMVYVPQGNFRLGGGNGMEVGKIFERSGPLNFSNPYLITSEAAIQVGITNGNLYYNSPVDHDAGDQQGPIPAQFPKGFQGFYCMKYEVTQIQWIQFFNSLTPAQQTNNDITDLDHRGPNPIDRNNIEWEGTGGAYTSNPYVPMSFPLWGETLAYLDWSGLRPMSELEFVKACRGPGAVIPNGYAWGSVDIIETGFTYDLLNKGSENELLVNHVSGVGNANWIHSAIFEDGPYRSGIFAASAQFPNREDVGATFYGIMEMSGNLAEMAVTIGTPQGRNYKGVHGDGNLDAAGEADAITWPPITGEGGGLFGGSWFSEPESLQINDRRSATIGNVGYFNDVGFRGVRTVPQ